MLDEDITSGRRPIFLRALRAALGRAPLWLVTWALGLCAATILALPWARWFALSTQHAYAPGEILAWMPETFRFDHGDALGRLRSSDGMVAAIGACLMMLLGVFTAGGWLQVFLERTSGHSVRRFLWGGAKYFWRFSRLWILTLLLLSLLSWCLHGLPWEWVLGFLVGSTENDLEVVTSEWTAVWIEWIQAGLFATGFALVLVWGDYTRTRMALHDGRSALWAGICSLFLLIAHPVRMLRPMALVFAVEVALVGFLGTWSWGVNRGLGPESGWMELTQLFLLGQAAMLWQTISRAARYSVAVQVSQRLVAPLSQPDPWASRIGGPGGPQYPVDDTDDYNVSI